MNVLDFKVPEFCRISWVSQEADKTWSHRSNLISESWLNFEKELICTGKRQAAMQFTKLADLPALQSWAQEHGLALLIVGNSPLYGLRFALTRKPYEFFEAWSLGKLADIGYLLGYPECCIKAFVENWTELKRVDTTWPMARETIRHIDPRYDFSKKIHSITVNSSPYTSTMLHWLGIRFVPHLPCSFECEQTIRQGKENANAWKETGRKEVVAWAKEMLSWPVEYTALHGIAEIKTPIVRITCSTDPTVEKYTIRVQGTQFPLLGAPSLTRWCVPSNVKVDTWTDNGFSTEDVMIEFHAPILEAVGARVLEGIQRVIDLGCGNGLLLDKIATLYHIDPLVEVVGIESDKAKVSRGRRHEFVQFVTRNIYDVDSSQLKGQGKIKPTLVLLSTQRLKEATPEQLDRFLPRLLDIGDELMLYGYGDFDPAWEKSFVVEGWARTATGKDLVVLKRAS